MTPAGELWNPALNPNQRRSTGSQIMPIQNAAEPYLPKTGEMQPPSQKNSWVRVVVYLVLAIAVGFIVWRVYQNKQKTAANTANQAAALLGRPVPVQVAVVEQKPMPIYLTGLGTVTP